MVSEMTTAQKPEAIILYHTNVLDSATNKEWTTHKPLLPCDQFVALTPESLEQIVRNTMAINNAGPPSSVEIDDYIKALWERLGL